jgi:hypothetical protein
VASMIAMAVVFRCFMGGLLSGAVGMDEW